jgi:predicted glutamine amidotransferase
MVAARLDSTASLKISVNGAFDGVAPATTRAAMPNARRDGSHAASVQGGALGWWRAGGAWRFRLRPTVRHITQIDVAAALQPERHEHVSLIGFASPVPTPTEQIGEDEVAPFGDMSALHADGWGTAWLQPEAAHPQRLQLEGYRSIERAPRDPWFAELAECTPTVALLVHLRWATEGLAVSFANTHPFSQDGITVAHNGSISPRPMLDSLLSPAARASLHGTTDSERYLALIRQELHTGLYLPAALARAMSTLRGSFPHASLNALTLSENTFITVHASATSAAPVEDMLVSGIEHEDLPLDHIHRYFLMRWRRGIDGAVVFSSSGLIEERLGGVAGRVDHDRRLGRHGGVRP